MGTQLALAVERLPFLTRAQALEDGERNPKFWQYLGSLMVSPDPSAAVDNELKRAAIDALAPGKYPEAGGNWPMFKAKIRTIRDTISGHLRSGGSLQGLFDLTALAQLPGGTVTSYSQLMEPTKPAADTGTTDIWGTIGKVLSTVGTAAASIYSTKIQTSAAQSIANTQAGVLTAQQQAQQQAAAAQVAQQQAALLAAQKQVGTSGGSGSVILYVLLGLLGLGGLMFLMSRLNK